ncbi:homeobox protein Mix.1-like [Liolophura sinensis]|uniref:homeobox protein Mix.1-like n=1 Tax=Liolophura sinensis TaxID=3198878 RepID=UPI0031592515
MDIVSAARILYYRNTNTQQRYANRRTSPETPAVPRLYTRTLLRQQELEILKLVFAACHYPDKVVVESLSQQLNVPTSRIQAWFIKRRAARRRKEISYIGSRNNVAIENLERPAPVVESHQRQANTDTKGQDMMIMATQGIQDPADSVHLDLDQLYYNGDLHGVAEEAGGAKRHGYQQKNSSSSKRKINAVMGNLAQTTLVMPPLRQRNTDAEGQDMVLMSTHMEYGDLDIPNVLTQSMLISLYANKRNTVICVIWRTG